MSPPQRENHEVRLHESNQPFRELDVGWLPTPSTHVAPMMGKDEYWCSEVWSRTPVHKMFESQRVQEGYAKPFTIGVSPLPPKVSVQSATRRTKCNATASPSDTKEVTSQPSG
jgi:hypothetical protein